MVPKDQGLWWRLNFHFPAHTQSSLNWNTGGVNSSSFGESSQELGSWGTGCGHDRRNCDLSQNLGGAGGACRCAADGSFLLRSLTGELVSPEGVLPTPDTLNTP